MLLSITTTHEPATDLGYLLHKHPDRPWTTSTSTGTAHVFYPQAADTSCTAVLMLEVDPIALVRAHKGGGELTHYVNDRPYAASSMLAVALKEAFRTALTGRCDARPELAGTAIPLTIRVPAVRCRGGAELARRAFEPLGWTVEATPLRYDPPEWGDSPYLDLRLSGRLKVADALNHLYVLLPALDDAKHYWVSADEIDKLLRAGENWLAQHPDSALITRRYLSHRSALTAAALARLAEVDETGPEELDNAVTDEEAGEEPGDEQAAPAKPLAQQRREAILAVLRELGVRTVADLGCGAGALTRDLLAERTIDQVLATDVSARALMLAAGRLRLERMPQRQRDRLKIFQSALTYRDDRLKGLDAAVLMEVIEHVDPPRLPALERAVFGYAAPDAVIVTTPNREYNAHFDTPMPDGVMRHRDHRFEWTRAEFRQWADRVSREYGYDAGFRPVGPEHPQAGPPTQLAVFAKPGRGPC